MEQNKYKYLIIEDSKLKWRGDLESLKRFIADDLNLSGKWSSPGGDARAFTNENEISTEGDIVKIKWYQGKKTLLFQGSGAKQIEEDLYRKIQLKSSSSEGETCSRFECSNLHNNDKVSESLNDFKLQFQQLKEVTEQNKISIDNLESKCKTLQSSSDTTRLELYKLRNEYEVMSSENANLRKENAEYLACMNGLAGTIADLNIKIKSLNEEKASLEASVRLLNEDKCQLIFNKNNVSYDHEREQSLVETTQVEKNGNTNNNQNSLPNSKGPIGLMGLTLMDQNTTPTAARDVSIVESKDVNEGALSKYSKNTNTENPLVVPSVIASTIHDQFDPPTNKNVYFPPGEKNILSNNDNGACYVTLDELRGDAGQRRCNSKKKLTYAEVLKSNNANISSQLISKSSDNPKENCDEMLSNTDGFVGVQRKRKKFKSFFVSGISEHVKEKQISLYLSRRNVIPSHISVFPSKRKGTISAKIGIPIASVSKVQEKTFWPMYVYCKPWRQNDKRKPVVQRINNMPQTEEYTTYV